MPLTCIGCGLELQTPADAIVDGRLDRCLVCAGTEFYVRKDFSQRTGVAIVVAGLAMSCVAWFFRRFYLTYSILFATALLDACLYLMRGSLLQCYRCQAEYRGLDERSATEPFRLETHDKHRQQSARLAQHQSATHR
jgi:hypothetical protein